MRELEEGHSHNKQLQASFASLTPSSTAREARRACNLER